METLTMAEIEMAFTKWWGSAECLAENWHDFAMYLIPIAAEKNNGK
jgi:hypothetical protein